MYVREATAFDAPYIADISMQVFGERNVEKIERDIENPNYVYYVLLNDSDMIVSYMSLMLTTLDADVLMVVTDRHNRGKGYASVLMKEVLSSLKQKGISDVYLEVRENNDIARKLYKRFGFEPVSIRKKYYDGTIDGIVMKLSI